MRNTSLVQSFRSAAAGLLYATRTQRNLRIHLAIAAAVVGIGLWLDLPVGQWAVLALTVGFVLVSEIFNTVLEALVDLVSPQYHPVARVVKDATAGAVLLAALVAMVVGLLVLGPPLWERLLRPRP
jgi:diacylglycerol kinase